MLRRQAGGITLGMRILDALAAIGAGILAYGLRFGDFNIPGTYEIALVLGLLLTVVIFPVFGVYRAFQEGNVWHEMRQVSIAWGAVIGSLIVMSFATQTGILYSRLWVGTWALTGWVCLLLVHAASHRLLHLMKQKGWGRRKAVVVGGGSLGRDVIRNLQRNPWAGIDVVGVVDDDPGLHGSFVEGVPVRGGTEAFPGLLDEGIDEVWLALPLRAEDRIKAILEDLQGRFVAVRFIPDIFEFRLLNHAIAEIGGMPVVDLNVSPMVGFNRLAKACLDYTLASVILVAASPLMVLIALGIKLTSPGPVIFRQERIGWDGRPFVIYKFRTMREGASRGAWTTRKDDPRVTPFGRFLRRTSLDELPQFINVLQGRMSIVGPRPHVPQVNDRFKASISAYMERHKVKPGITGWAQVSGMRGEADTDERMEKRIAYDIYYIEHWSIWFDLKIIA
ncbi:MAG: undecaprenyl-phosphate glucose phosphotransferase, partial [Gammaproteobacteria bacterium]